MEMPYSRPIVSLTLCHCDSSTPEYDSGSHATDRYLLAEKDRSSERPFETISGDGGNRTHVRGRVMDSFYERSQGSGSRLPVAAPTGFRLASRLTCPGSAGGARAQ